MQQMNASHLVAWLRALAWLVIAVAGLWVVSQIHYTIATFTLAAIISYLLYPVVSWLFVNSAVLVGRTLSWPVSVLLVYSFLPILLGGALWLTVPAVTVQFETVTQNLPHQVERLQGAAAYWQGRFEKVRVPAAVREQMQALVTQALNRFAEFVGNLVGYVANGLLSTVTWTLFGLVALIISNLMLLTLPETRRKLFDVVPESYRDEVSQLLVEVNLVFGGFIKGMGILSVFAGLLVYVLLNGLALLSWLGVPAMMPCQYALILATATLVLYPIPILGLLLLAALGGLTAYLQEGSSMVYALTVAGILAGAVVTVDRVVGPRVMSQAMGVSPLFVMFSAFAGAELMGFWGMILGVPMAAAGKVLFQYVHKRFLAPQSALGNAAEGGEAVSANVSGGEPAPVQPYSEESPS